MSEPVWLALNSFCCGIATASVVWTVVTRLPFWVVAMNGFAAVFNLAVVMGKLL